MSIHFISGKPRAGKSFYGLKLIVEELTRGERPVITNLPVNMGELNAYLQTKYPQKSINLFERVRLLTDEETKEFWRHRPGFLVPRLQKEEWRAGKVPDYAGVRDHGVFWVVDELHNFFGSRQWMDTGQDVLFYLSQHGHLGDTFVGITQAVNNVDRQFRSVAQDYTFIRNFRKEKMGLFRMPGVFMRRTFLSPPSETSVPMETGTFMLDVRGLAKCYSTVAGVGIHDRGAADKKEVKRGLPWWAGLGALASVVILIFGYGPDLLLHLFHFDNKPTKVQARTVATVPATAAPVPSQAKSLDTNRVDVTGTAYWNGYTYLTLSNGAIVRTKNAVFAVDHVVADGVRYERKPGL